MVDILWKIDSRNTTLEEQEFYELRLVDLGLYEKPRFLVREIHARWLERHQQVNWDGSEDYTCHTPEGAQRCFQTRRAAIAAKGFTNSDVELSWAS